MGQHPSVRRLVRQLFDLVCAKFFVETLVIYGRCIGFPDTVLLFGNLDLKVVGAINKSISVVVELRSMTVNLLNSEADSELEGDTNFHRAVLYSVPCEQAVAKLYHNAKNAVEDKTGYCCISNEWPGNEEIE